MYGRSEDENSSGCLECPASRLGLFEDFEGSVMKNWNRQLFWLVVIASLVASAFAQQKTINLPQDNPMSRIKPGSGEETVRMYCSACHSTDYIVRQPRLDASRWAAEVTRMIDVFGARINSSDAKAIADYLAKNYGPEQAADKR